MPAMRARILPLHSSHSLHRRTVAQAPTFDILIRNGRVLDGTGNPWYRADIGITGDRIRAMGRLGNATAKTVIDAGDRYVTPGFIDVHSHAGGGLATDELKHGQPLLAQGLTTVFVNPDGGGPVDLAAQRATYEKQRIGTNVGADGAARIDPPRGDGRCRIAIRMRASWRRWSS